MHRTTFADFEKMKKMAPQAHVFTNFQNLGLDAKKMAKEDPILFSYANSILTDEWSKKTQNLWNNYVNAYAWAKENNFLSTKRTVDVLMQKEIQKFEQKVAGPCLIPLKKLEEVVAERKFKKQITIQLQYNDFIDLLEKYYKIETRGFFDCLNNFQDDKLMKMLDLNKKEYDKYSNISPIDSEISARLCLLSDIQRTTNGAPYVDFWHHLLDFDFASISNGSVATLWNEEQDDEMENKNNQEVSNKVFSLIRKAIFKEIAQLPAFKGEIPSEVECYIYW